MKNNRNILNFIEIKRTIFGRKKSIIIKDFQIMK